MNNAIVPQFAVVCGRPVTTSLNVADVFGKQHKDVLKAIGRVKNDVSVSDAEFGRRNFAPSSYLNEQGKEQPMFQVTRDGFTLLAMGFTGKEAMKFKLAYIDAFNRMESELLNLAGSGERKTVRVNHTHLRGTTAPGNLDIRYTMDLSKVVMRPTRVGIELLERLTGIPLADILPDPAEGSSDLAARFARECLVVVADAAGREQLGDIHQRFLIWHKDFGGKIPPTLKWLAAALRGMGLTVMIRGGRAWVFGVRLAQEVDA
ncbi:MAG: Rha family transcriptional regulator [Limnohabitans sp.]